MAYFDARIFSGIAQSVFSSRALHGHKLDDVLNMLRDRGIMINDFNPHLLYGTFLKKKLVNVIGFDPKTKENVTVQRGRLYSDQVKLDDFNLEQQTTFVMAKYWPK